MVASVSSVEMVHTLRSFPAGAGIFDQTSLPVARRLVGCLRDDKVGGVVIHGLRLRYMASKWECYGMERRACSSFGTSPTVAELSL
jgi:hypothetical protein